MNERDTHFQGFAHLLYEDFLRLAQEDKSSLNEQFASDYPEKWRATVEQLIARRAYDLVFHLLKNSDPLHLDMSGYLSDPPDDDVRQCIASLPDLTAWPEPTE